ncbi:putative 23S rRNA ribose 2'-O-ribose methyltransferase [Botrimarina colliarenosi]|uniref:Putative 23S rRNA ribose 2'-O-ribose methyltransferase n=1 Tax=Botrimarina colliarenosi TaxID=2528001 RepID=A0A5C6AEH3_9BACT|nr:SAM-dependent methyltransferase [Botrimarina colliarenosi]TWT98009.1 putative 23S rRNA ribose 2'-O-ribose methyltransferase [Botrimarina colliarenosi]
MAVETEFVYCTCQPGAEPALKGEVAARVPEWKFAFSRPGFVTFKLPAPVSANRFEPMRLTFARTSGLSFGRVEAESADPAALAKLIWEHGAARQLAETGPLALHVWARDTDLPGENNVEPGPNAETFAAVAALREAAPAGALVDRSNEDEKKTASKVAFDVAMVEPNQWWIGAHALRSRVDRWPGGVPRLEAPQHAVSRAYLKMQEGLRWSGIPAQKGDYWIELGCAPGGASQALLDVGMRVVGVDPAEVDPVVLAHPDFEHLNARASEIGVDEVTDAAWITADINCAPQYTLDGVERLVTHPSMHVRGLLLTLKLLSLNLAKPEVIAETIARVRSWGYTDVRTRQLAHNRREYCLAALRTRGQRRVKRSGVVKKGR